MAVEGESVLTPLIVVSFSEEGAKNAVGGGNFQSIVGGEDVFAFPNSHSNNFTKLTHTYNVEGGGGWRIRLEMIDPVAEFEAKFLSLRMEDVLANQLHITEGEVTSDVEKKLIELEEKNMPSIGSIGKIIEATQRQRVWITYGVGGDPEDWAGPFAVFCSGAKLKIDTGNIKKLVLDFSPNGDLVTTPSGPLGKRSVKTDGIARSAIGRVGPFKVGEGKPVGSEEYGGGSVGNWSKYAEKAGVDAKDELNVFFQNFDVHATIMTCIRTMVRQATACNNVVTLFPNINCYGIKAIATAIACDRGTGIKPDEEKEQWLIDAADKVFSRLGAQFCIYELGKLINEDPTDKTLLPTSYEEYLDAFKDCKSVREEYVKKAKFYVEMESTTDVADGHKAGINAAISKIREALTNCSYGYHPQFIVESRPDIIKAFKGSPGVKGDGPIVFYGDQALIRNIVYDSGSKAKEFLHPSDQKLVGKGVGPMSAKAKALPEFRINTPDPNIISIDSINDKAYIAALVNGFETNAKAKVANVQATLTEASEAYGNIPEVDEVIDGLKLSGSAENAAAQLIVAACRNVTKTEAKTRIKMNPSMVNNPIGILTSLYEQMHKTMLNLTITTLPHFHLSDISVQGKECIVLGSMPAALVPGNPPKPLKTGYDIENAWFNGAYQIVGFIHEISSTGIAKSKFVLTKIMKQDEEAPPAPSTSGGGYEI